MFLPETISQKYPRSNLYNTRIYEAFEQLQKLYHPSQHQTLFQEDISKAELAAELNLDSTCVVSSFLFNAFQKNFLGNDLVKASFGEEILLILNGLKKLTQISSYIQIEDKVVEYLREMIFVSLKDIRVLIVQFIFQLYKLKSFKNSEDINKKDFAIGCVDIYAPIAHRLGLSQIKNDLENLSFQWIFPEQYAQIKEFCDRGEQRWKKILESILNTLNHAFAEENFPADVQSRIKTYYSIFRKAQKSNIDYDHIHDLLAVRILVNSKSDCYKVLGIIHEHFKSVAGRLKDYISVPKENGYQSLHTTLIYQGNLFEVQIRTHEMHKVAEMGIAAHWSYKEKKISDDQEVKNILWLRKLTKSIVNLSDPADSIKVFNREIYSDYIYTVTPKGSIIKLPHGASVIDFAYAIHSDVGKQCKSAKVNGKQVPIRTHLNNGDRVEIVTSSNQSPSKDWLKYAVTAKALNKIRHEIKIQEADEAEKIGEQIVRKKLKNNSINFDNIPDSTFNKFLQHFEFKSLKEYFNKVSYGKADSKALLGFLEENQVESPSVKERIRKVFSSQKEKIKISGIENLLFRFASCCSPLKGDDIIGLVTNGKGISIHRKKCINIRNGDFDPNRLLEIEWDEKTDYSKPVSLVVEYSNHSDNLSILKILSNSKSRLVESQMKESQNGISQKMKILVNDLNHLRKIQYRLKQIPNLKILKVD